MKSLRLLSTLGIFLSSACVVLSATFTITKTSDDGSKDTLRWAIDQAEQNGPGMDQIDFNISGTGPHVIYLKTELTIGSSVTIDGYTQKGASPNTLASGNDADLRVVLDGANISPRSTLPFPGSGILVQSDNVSLIGLVVRNAPGIGVAVASSTQIGFSIEGCFVGIDSDGMTAAPNQAGGIYTEGQKGTIGGPLPAQRNVISGNGDTGITITYIGNTVQGNFIGTNRNGGVPPPLLIAQGVGNQGQGIVIAGGGNNTIGTRPPVSPTAPNDTANVIAGNSEDGILVIGKAVSTNPNATEFGSGNAIMGNSIHSNGLVFAADNALGIDLGLLEFNATSGDDEILHQGVNWNDQADVDGGPNELMNFPILSGAVAGPSPGEIRIFGALSTFAGGSFTIEFFVNKDADVDEQDSRPTDSGHGQGQRFIGRKTFVLQPIAGLNFTETLPLPPGHYINNGEYITATATDSRGNTSEFSPSFQYNGVKIGSSGQVSIPTLPTSLAAIGNAGDLDPNTFSFTLEWTAPPGTLTRVVSSTDLRTPLDQWTAVADFIIPSPPESPIISQIVVIDVSQPFDNFYQIVIP